MKKDQGVTYYPVFLNVKDRKCVVVGGGQVALRKARVMLEHGADVEVISPDFCPALVRLTDSGAICALNREYQEGDLQNAFVTIAATDSDETNQRVASEARRVLFRVDTRKGVAPRILTLERRRLALVEDVDTPA